MQARVAIIDSGIDLTHPAFLGREITELVVEPKGATYSIAKKPLGDASGHGTACAGIILRLAPFASIASIRALGADGRGSREALAAALRFAIKERFDVVNLSLGIDFPRGQPLKPTDYRSVIELYEIADDAYAGRVMLVAAGPNVTSLRTYPGRAKSLIGVGRGSFADPETLELSISADHDVLAPGVDVLAPALGGTERRYSGTSFACPHVSAHLARIIARHPAANATEVRTKLYALASVSKSEPVGGLS